MYNIHIMDDANMRKKLLFTSLITCLFATVAAIGLASPKYTKSNAENPHFSTNNAANGDSFNTAEIGRDELTVDLSSCTSAEDSKSITVTFATTRLTGWGNSKRNIYLVIDDPDYSGVPTNPSISGKTKPTFNGYTIFMDNINTASITYTDKETKEKHTLNDFIVPTKMTYGDGFTIANNSIIKDAFVYETGKKPAFDYLVIPKGITSIAAGAFVNIPDEITIRCEDESKPAGWEDGWCDAANIEWGYTLVDESITGKKVGNETDYISQSTGANEKFFGKLANNATEETETIYAIVDSPNWTGDFDNPLRSIKGLVKPYHLNAYINEIVDSPSNPNVVIPTTMKYGEDLILDIKNVSSGVIKFNYDSEKQYTGSIESITLPSSLENLPAGVFSKVPESVKIKCESTSQPGDWSSSWYNPTSTNPIQWNTSIPEEKKNISITDVSRQVRLSNEAETYIIGYKYTKSAKYFCEHCKEYVKESDLIDGKCPKCHGSVTELPDLTPEYNLPVTVTYQIKNSQGATRDIVEELPLSSEEETSTSTSYFDSVKSSPVDKSFDILLDEGEQIVENSFKVYNIFKAKTVKVFGKTVENGQIVEKYVSFMVPDTELEYTATALKRYRQETDIREVIDYSFSGVSTFNNFTKVSMNVDKVFPSYWYKGVSPDIVKTNQEFIDSGAYSIRYAFYNLGSSFYRITYYSPSANDEVNCVMPIKTTNGVIVLEKDKGNDISFLIEDKTVFYKNDEGKAVYDFKPENLKQFEIISLTINIHLWNNAKNIKVGRTDLSIHFGAVNVLPYSPNGVSIYKVNDALIISIAIYTAVFAALAVGLFFLLKNKFKNDEFRRVKPKKYLKSAILGYLGSAVVFLTIMFIIFRTTVFSNSIATHNPIDAFIVVPGVISIVIIGYFIKFIVTKVKASKQRKRNAKLHLDNNND